MSNRDTTSTPYKLSADGVCYFAYPNGDAPIVTVTSYTELRTKNASHTTTGTIYLNHAQHGGGFKFSSSDPYGLGDDGGLVIAASGGGWWVRQFTYGEMSPVKLQWFESVVADFNVTALLLSIVSRFSTSYVEFPPLSRLYLSSYTSTGNHRWTAPAPITLKMPTGAAYPARIFQLAGHTKLYTAANITFECDNTNETTARTEDAVFSITNSGATTSVELRHNTLKPACHAIAITGASPSCNIVIAGSHQNGGCNAGANSSDTGNVHFDKPVFWCTYKDKPARITRGSIVSYGYANGKITGHIILRNFATYFFYTGAAGGKGNSAADPLILEFNDFGYDEDGDVIPDFMGLGKTDSCGNGTVPCYVRFLLTGKFRGDSFVNAEATPENPGVVYRYNYHHVEIVKNTTSMITNNGISMPAPQSDDGTRNGSKLIAPTSHGAGTGSPPYAKSTTINSKVQTSNPEFIFLGSNINVGNIVTYQSTTMAGRNVTLYSDGYLLTDFLSSETTPDELQYAVSTNGGASWGAPQKWTFACQTTYFSKQEMDPLNASGYPYYWSGAGTEGIGNSMSGWSGALQIFSIADDCHVHDMELSGTILSTTPRLLVVRAFNQPWANLRDVLLERVTFYPATLPDIVINTGNDIVFKDCVFTGPARNICKVHAVWYGETFRHPPGIWYPEHEPVVVRFDNLTAPSGSTITKDLSNNASSDVTLYVDGVVKTLPYTVP